VRAGLGVGVVPRDATAIVFPSLMLASRPLLAMLYYHSMLRTQLQNQ